MKKTRRKILSVVLALTLAFMLPGCGKDAVESDVPGIGNAEGADAQAQGGENSDNASSSAMGRYVETEIDLSEQLHDAQGLYKLDDGSLVIPDGVQGLLVSRDKGSTWELETPEWMLDMLTNGYYISEMAMAPDGTIAVLYDESMDSEYQPIMSLILPDGTFVPVEIEMTEEDKYVVQFATTKDSRIFCRTICGNIYEVQKDGSSAPLSQAQEFCSRFYMAGELLIRDTDGHKDKTPSLYDTSSEMFIEDEVLASFIRENYNSRYYDGNYACSMYILPEDDSVLYLIGGKGIHRHAVGGNMMEQIVDGGLSMLSNPSYVIESVVALEGEEFLVLFANHKLLRFTYDANVPTVPERILSVYSLCEDEDLRQAISMYQAKNPDIFVSYEIGMAESDSVTREDAVKKLNTEIIAGNGPDLIVMDGLPFTSYVEKGMLLDLTDYIEEYSAEEPLFDNIIDTLKIGGKAYVVPATIHVPLLIGKNDTVTALTDLDQVGEAVEKLRSEHPGDDIIGICSADDILKRFVGVSAPAWVAENGALDRDAIGTYIEQCKRIYNAQMDGIRSDIVEDYMNLANSLTTSGNHGLGWKIDWSIANSIFGYIAGEKHLLSGWVESPHGYNECLSLKRTEGFEDCGIADMQGQCGHVFKPNTLLGISATSTQLDDAKAFMGFFLSAEAQESFYSFPLNKEAYNKQYGVDEKYVDDDGGYGYLSLVNEDGLVVGFTVYQASKEQIGDFEEKLALLDTAYIQDVVLENAVLDRGSAYMKGELTLEEALNEIEKQVAIYMAE